MAITTRIGKLLSNQSSDGTKDKKVKEKVVTGEDEITPLDDLEEIQHKTSAGEKKKEI